jgi:hypothetical protein
MATGVIFDENSARELRSELMELRRDAQNLRRNLAYLIARDRRDDPSVSLPTVRFKNTASETMPAWAIMRVTTGGTSSYLAAAKPDATYRWLYLVNGPGIVAQNGFGAASFLSSDTFCLNRGFALYDTGATPAYGERWGPKSDSWKLWQHRPGFLILGSNVGTGEQSRTAVLQVPPGEVRVQNDDGSGALAAGGGPRTFGIYAGSAGTTDTGLEVAIYNGSTTSWAATKYGFATADAGGVVWGAPHQT